MSKVKDPLVNGNKKDPTFKYLSSMKIDDKSHDSCGIVGRMYWIRFLHIFNLKPENASNTANKPACEVKRTFRKLVVEEEIHTTRLGCFFFARLYLNLKETRHK